MMFQGRITHGFVGVLPINSDKNFSTMAPMNKQNLAGLFVGTCLCALPFASQAQSVQVNIMPFGDSVTAFGSNPESSYRYWLWHDLQDAGFSNINFVGSNSGVGDGAPANSDFDQDYEGGGQDWTSQTALNDAQHAANQGADIVLLDFGSNDFGEGWDLTQTRSNLDQTIETIRGTKPDVIILIAKPTGWVTTDRTESKFKSQLASTISKVAKDEKKAGANIKVVSLFGSFNPKKDTKDGTHPNVQGEQKIARKYFSALKPILKKM
jgi:lysophospholipase L1-like esterase